MSQQGPHHYAKVHEKKEEAEETLETLLQKTIIPFLLSEAEGVGRFPHCGETSLAEPA